MRIEVLIVMEMSHVMLCSLVYSHKGFSEYTHLQSKISVSALNIEAVFLENH
jgi:hypothetical protein